MIPRWDAGIPAVSYKPAGSRQSLAGLGFQAGLRDPPSADRQGCGRRCWTRITAPSRQDRGKRLMGWDPRLASRDPSCYITGAVAADGYRDPSFLTGNVSGRGCSGGIPGWDPRTSVNRRDRGTCYSAGILGWDKFLHLFYMFLYVLYMFYICFLLVLKRE